jgi:hypothetical protein
MTTTFQEKSDLISGKIAELRTEIASLLQELYGLSDGFRYVCKTTRWGITSYALFNKIEAADIAYENFMNGGQNGVIYVFTDNPDISGMYCTTSLSVAEMDELIASNKITF